MTSKTKTEATTLITIDEVVKLLREKLKLKKLSRSSIYYWMKTKSLPPSVGFGVPRRWRKNEIDDWVRDQIEGK